MYKIIAPVIFLAFIISAALQSEARIPLDKDKPNPDAVSLGEFVYTVPLNKEMPSVDAPVRWYHEYFEPHVNDSVIGPLLDMIKKKQIDVYEPVYPYKEKMDAQRAQEIFIRTDSVEMEMENNPGTFVMIGIVNQRTADQISSLTFHEQWYYEPSTLTLTKTVLGIIPNMYSDEIGVKGTCYIPINNQASTSPTVTVSGITSDFIADGTTHERSPNNYNLKVDSAIAANQAAVSSRILSDIVLRAQEKDFTLYEANFPFVQGVDKKTKPEKIIRLQHSNMLMFSEDWEIDARHLVFRKKVRGVVPMKEKQIWAEDSSSYEWKYESSAFVPFNGIVPVKMMPDMCVIDRITYNLNYKDEKLPGVPWISTRDSIRVDSMAYDIREHVKRREIKSYGPVDRYDLCGPFDAPCKELNEDQIRNTFAMFDTVLVETFAEPVTEIREHEIGHDLTTGYRFFEKWIFDFKQQTFAKQTSYIGGNRMLLDNYGEVKVTSYFNYYYKNPVTTAEESKKSQYVYHANVVSGCILNYTEFNYNEDWWGNRIVSYYDESFENIPASKRYAFLQPVVEMVLEGKMKAYAMVSDNNPMTPAAFTQMMNNVAGKYKLTLVPGMEYALFNQVYFHEEWYYNLVTGQIYKEVNAITFAHRDWDTYDPDSYERTIHIEPCFTIKLNMVK